MKDWRVMPLVLAVNYGEYDTKKYLELLGRAYQTIVEGLQVKPTLAFASKNGMIPVVEIPHL